MYATPWNLGGTKPDQQGIKQLHMTAFIGERKKFDLLRRWVSAGEERETTASERENFSVI